MIHGFLGPVETLDLHDPLAPLQQRLSPLKKPKGLKKRKGIVSRVPVPSMVSPNGPGGAVMRFAPDLPDSNGDVSQGHNFPDLAKN